MIYKLKKSEFQLSDEPDIQSIAIFGEEERSFEKQ